MNRYLARLLIFYLIFAFEVLSQIEIIDDLGRKLVFRDPPTRIISLAPSITETLYSLSLGDKIVGVTRYCNFPPEAQNKTIIGGVIDPNYEIIASLKPDLIIMTVEGNTRESFVKLSELGFRIFVTNPRDFNGIFKTILDFGKIFGVEPKAKNLVDSLKMELSKIRKHSIISRKPKIFVVLSLNPLMTAGKNTFINEIIERAGGLNIAGNLKQNYPILNREEILKVNPDIIILTEQNVDKDELLKQFPEWRHINAIKKNEIFKIEPDILFRPSPRVILATKIVAQIINKSSK